MLVLFKLSVVVDFSLECVFSMLFLDCMCSCWCADHIELLEGSFAPFTKPRLMHGVPVPKVCVVLFRVIVLLLLLC